MVYIYKSRYYSIYVWSLSLKNWRSFQLLWFSFSGSLRASPSVASVDTGSSSELTNPLTSSNSQFKNISPCNNIDIYGSTVTETCRSLCSLKISLLFLCRWTNVWKCRLKVLNLNWISIHLHNVRNKVEWWKKKKKKKKRIKN